jgi:tetratricopeptide (TPR) repeat protein
LEKQKAAAPIRTSPTFGQEQAGRDLTHLSRRHSLPEAIASLLDRRLSRLSAECQTLLGKAAVLGGSFELSQLLPMATEHTEDALLDLLEEALHARLLTEEVTDTQITYHFWHPLIVSHLYARLSATRRTQLHKRAVEAIRAIHPASQEEKMAATIAYHLTKGGGDTTSIAHYAELAGNSAYSIAAYSEAQQHYLQALQALMGERASTLDSTNLALHLRHFIHHIHEKLFSTRADTRRICRLLEFIAECSRVQGNFEDARHLYEAILALRTSDALQQPVYLPTREREDNRQQEAQIQALLWREIGHTWTATGEYKRAYECYECGKAVMIEAGVTSGAAWACLHLQYGVLLRIEGNYHEAHLYLREALEILERVAPPAASHLASARVSSEAYPPVTPSAFSSEAAPSYRQPQTRTELALQGDPLDIGYVHEQLGVVAASVGHLSDALTHMHTALTIYEQRARVSEIARLCGNLGNIYIIKGEHASARVYLQRSLDLAERTGDLPNMAFVANNLGEVAHRSGELVEAEAWFQRSLAYAERINDREQISWCSVDLAAVQRDLGKLGEATSSVYRAITTGRAIKSPRCTRYALVALSDLRIIEAIILCRLLPKGKNDDSRFRQCRRLLRQVTSTLQRATSLEGLEAEPMIGGKLLLATAYFLLNDLEMARQLTEQTLAEAQQHETTRAIGRAHRLLGRILTAQDQYKEAMAHYTQAMQIFQDRELRLDYARTVHGYGTALAQWNADQEARGKAYQQGLDYLREAHAIFVDCQASVDRVWVERVLEQFAPQSKTGVIETKGENAR